MFRKQKLNWMKFKSLHIFSTKNNSKVATLDEKAQQKYSIPRAGKIAHQVKVLAFNPEDFRMIPGFHILGGEN